MEGGKRRAPGIAILAVLAFAWGIMTWLAAITQGGGGLAPVDAPAFRGSMFLISRDAWTNVKFYAFVFPPLVAGVGVLMRKEWARVLFIVYALGMICFFVVTILRDIFDRVPVHLYLGYFIPPTVAFSVPIWYFSRPPIKERFSRR